MTPVRIRRQRTRGWRMPEGAIYVGRPGIYGNPMSIRDDPAFAVAWYRRWLERHPDGRRIAQAAAVDLAGRNLACWCRLDQPCHADVLLELANSPTSDRSE